MSHSTSQSDTKLQAPPLVSALHEGVLTLTLNRPEARNALNPEITSGLILALEQAQRDTAVRAVVLTGAGGAFCAGGDVKAMATPQMQSMNLAERQRLLRQRADASRLLHEMPKPTIAVIRPEQAWRSHSLAISDSPHARPRSARPSPKWAYRVTMA